MEKPLSNVAKQILPRLIQISGCSFETFTNNEFLEIETLGPMTKLLPGETVEHTEHWALFRDVKVAELTDKELDEVLLPLVQTVAGAK